MRRTHQTRPRPAVERLEARQLLSVSNPTATVDSSYSAAAASSPAVAPFTPAQLRHFYGVDAINFGSTAGNGAGQTIAIIAADNQPTIASDLSSFDSAYGLAAPPSFKIVNQTGGSTLPGTVNTSASIETSLDVEWAHGMAPGANLLLIECNSTQFSDLISAGVNEANDTAGVSVVSLSYGAPEFSSESGYDQDFTRAGITYVASAGDAGSADTFYPATSPDVVGVGGTQIMTSDSSGSYGSETAWNDPPPQTSSNFPGATGGGVSKYEPKPGYQSSVAGSQFDRTAPDISFDASTNTGVYVVSGGAKYKVGGTSLSAPCWAGLIAIADQGRATQGESSLSGSTQTLPMLYKLPSADFHDITTGNNNYNNTGGYNASAGYDLASGLGTPVANVLIPALAGIAASGTVTGQVFQDDNADGSLDGSDTGLAGVTVYLDENEDGVHQSTEPTAVTNSSGGYLFTGISAGTIGQVLPISSTGFIQVATAPFTVGSGQTATANIALFPTVFSDSTAGRAFTVESSPSNSAELNILINGTVTYQAPVSFVPSLSFSLTGKAETMTVSFLFGNPLYGSLTVNGTSTANDDILDIIGTENSDTIAVSSGSVVFGGKTINYSNMPDLIVDPLNGSDSLTINSGTVNLPYALAGGGILSRTFSTLSIASGAKLAVATSTTKANRTLLQVSNLSIGGTGQLDLGGNDMIVNNSSLATMTALVKTGYAGRAWTGDGITSSVVAGDTTHLTSLGVIQNNQSGSALYTSSNPFDGATPATSAILVKYTYVGDANLNGTIDGSDYALIDAGFAARGKLTGWYNGDFNYDGSVDGSDYSLVDFTDSKKLTAIPAAQPAAMPAASVATAPDPATAKSSTPVRAIPAAFWIETDDLRRGKAVKNTASHPIELQTR